MDARRDTTPDIRKRTFRFAAQIVQLVRQLPRDTAGYAVGKQLVRSGTSIGANVEEAQAAQTRREFIRKMTIAQGEARETHYWLRLLKETQLAPNEHLKGALIDIDEICRIITAILTTTKRNDENVDN